MIEVNPHSSEFKRDWKERNWKQVQTTLENVKENQIQGDNKIPLPKLKSFYDEKNNSMLYTDKSNRQQNSCCRKNILR